MSWRSYSMAAKMRAEWRTVARVGRGQNFIACWGKLVEGVCFYDLFVSNRCEHMNMIYRCERNNTSANKHWRWDY